ncbi:MAG: 2-C-methyl-D-erythritol 4-phosphate cytidylyltransferase [Oscillatoriales cyanobacterium SM2_2_1]|nr:2-C-methyl-D-erythritol 4-phosphate cytidylyltransferase [Oscillatoriales cyanobacterium SM2_2_1]
MNGYLLIPAAGSGRRMGADRNKLLLPLLGEPILAWTLKAAIATPGVCWLGIMVHPQDRADITAIVAALHPEVPVELIEGGATRQASVWAGVQALPQGADSVLIHDGARCLATPNLFHRCWADLATTPALIAAVPVKDTIKEVVNQKIVHTPARDRLWAAQTPQGFHVPLLRAAHQQSLENGWEVTDDAALLERMGHEVAIVIGEETNLKITTPADLAIATLILQSRL